MDIETYALCKGIVKETSNLTFNITNDMWLGDSTNGYFIEPTSLPYPSNAIPQGAKVLGIKLVDFYGYTNINFYGIDYGLGITSTTNKLTKVVVKVIYKK